MRLHNKPLLLVAACLPVSIFTSLAQGITIYGDNGLTYEVKADFQIQLRRDVGDDQHLDVEYDDLELKNTITYNIGNGMSAFGQLDFSYDSAADNEDRSISRLEEAYLGIDFGHTSILFGKTDTAGDEFGVEKAYEKVGIPEDGFEEIADKGDDLIRLDAKWGNFYVAASTELEAEGEGAAADESLVDIFVSTQYAGFSIAAAYMDYQAGPQAESIDVTGISIAYGIFGADFSTIETDAGDTDIYNIVAGFKVAPTTSVGLGLNNVDTDSADDIAGWYANITYQFPAQKNVSLFAEIGDNDADDIDIGYLFGMRIKL